tara:strand:+ start:80 stop:412 length:333 start_codon:yes stop_codon:yes gene_type:complete
MTFQQITQDEIDYIRGIDDDEYDEITFPTLKKMMYEGDEEIPYYEINEAMTLCLRHIQNIYEHDDNQRRYLGITETPNFSLIIFYEDLNGSFRKVFLRPTWLGFKTFSQF